MSQVPVPGPTTYEQAVNLAGALAEAGVAELALTSQAGWSKLAPRHTDLPAVLEAASKQPDAELLALDRPIRVVLTPNSFLAFTNDPAFADALSRANPPDQPHA